MEESLQEIKELIIRSCLGECSAEEREALEGWCSRDEAHAAFYKRITAGWRAKSEALDGVDVRGALLRNRQLLRRRRVLRIARRSLPYAAVAVVLLGLLLRDTLRDEQGVPGTPLAIQPGRQQAELVLSDGSSIPLTPGMQENLQEGKAAINISANSISYTAADADTAVLYNTVRTPLGGEYTVALPDGTKVMLNALSELTYPICFSKNERRVRLMGEAYFNVKKDSCRPFYVDFKGTELQVLGTTFNVKAYEEEECWQATLCSGSVSLGGIRTGGQVLLVPGEQATGQVDGGEITVREVDTDLYTAWAKGEFRFDNTSIEEIFNVLKRWYGVEVFYANQQVRREVFTGKLPRFSDLQSILEVMEQVSDVRFELKGKTVTIR